MTPRYVQALLSKEVSRASPAVLVMQRHHDLGELLEPLHGILLLLGTEEERLVSVVDRRVAASIVEEEELHRRRVRKPTLPTHHVDDTRQIANLAQFELFRFAVRALLAERRPPILELAGGEPEVADVPEAAEPRARLLLQETLEDHAARRLTEPFDWAR